MKLDAENFLTHKLVEMGNRKTSAKNLSMDKPQKVSIQFKKGDKVILITIEGGDPEDGASRHWQEELYRALGMVTSMAAEDPVKPWYKKKPCPLRCDFMHPNGSVFFCKIFRKKTLEEKKALVKNVGLCGLCLGRNSKGHCNVQLCPQEEEEMALIVAWSEGESEDKEVISAWLDNKD